MKIKKIFRLNKCQDNSIDIDKFEEQVLENENKIEKDFAQPFADGKKPTPEEFVRYIVNKVEKDK
ncbi:MAG: hypothetical protein RSC41_05655 [Oscillospiraceae bacterium]